jgi:hypothetical protein
MIRKLYIKEIMPFGKYGIRILTRDLTAGIMTSA